MSVQKALNKRGFGSWVQQLHDSYSSPGCCKACPQVSATAAEVPVCSQIDVSLF